MTVSLASLNVSNGWIHRNPTTAVAEAEAANGRPYRLELEVTDKSILTDKDDFTAGRWRVLDNGIKVFNAITGNSNTPEDPAYEMFQESIKRAPNYNLATPLSPQQNENTFEYTPMKDVFSWSKNYMGIVARADNPETSALEKAKENMYQELKGKVENILQSTGNPPKGELIFGMKQDVPYFYEKIKTGNGISNVQNATGEIGNLIKDFWNTFHLMNKGANILI